MQRVQGALDDAVLWGCLFATLALDNSWFSSGLGPKVPPSLREPGAYI